MREADRPRHRAGRRVLGGDRAAVPRRHGGLQPPLRPVVQGGARPDPGGRHRQAGAAWRSPAATPSRRPTATSRLRRPVPRHDHPRLRHGPLPARRDRRGARGRRQPGRARRSPPRATSTPRSSCSARPTARSPHHEQPPRRLRLRPADRGVRRAPGMLERGQPAADQRAVRHRRPLRGRRAVPELLPSALRHRPTPPSSTTSSPRSRTARRPSRPSPTAAPRCVLADAANESLRTGRGVRV